MRTIMTLDKLTTIEQLEHFLDGSQVCSYEVLSSKDERYRWVQSTLVQFRYLILSKHDKGVVIRFLSHISGYSRAQLRRLISQYMKTGKCTRRQQTKRGFNRRYTDSDIQLLAELDELHEAPCGAVIKKFCQRAVQQGDLRYERLSSISVSHLYNLRKSNIYQKIRRHFTKTQPNKSPIGERRKPKPQGKPGYLRVDTVHQGDQGKQKGVYHINLVDEVTQFEISFAVEKISEQYLLPGLKQAMGILPFKIKGFHSDNGSEFINKTVAGLLEKMRVEFTKSRARKSNDNALVESKNGAVIRKHFGYAHIPQCFACEINDTVQMPLYRYQNFHRPCFFSEEIVGKNGKIKKTYPYKNLMTPFEKLVSLDEVDQYLKDGETLESLRRYAEKMTDSQAAIELKQAKQILFSQIQKKIA